jgi:hypothetical protein
MGFLNVEAPELACVDCSDVQISPVQPVLDLVAVPSAYFVTYP